MIVSKSFFERPTAQVAKALLGTYLCHRSPEGTTVGRIVETEAYLGLNDDASHSARGMTERNRAMFGAAGTCYVYFIYGVHYCFNVVTGDVGIGEAVLVRALEPISGVELMAKRRGTASLRALCSGPGKLVQAMGIGRSHNGTNLRTGALRLLTRDSFPKRYTGRERLPVATDVRIGIRRAAELPLRFYVKNSEFVSARS
ncbi:MAG: DNA-3-methyladenine glycosylase [Bdellovibrionota bacterium]